MTVDIDRPNYILNPTNCSLFETESTRDVDRSNSASKA